MWLIPQSLASVLASECSKRGLPPDSGISEESLAYFVTSSGTPTLRLSSWRGWKSRQWSRHLFGSETLRLSDGSSLLAQWISSALDSRVSRTQWLEAEKERTTTDGFGPPSRTAFAEWVQASSSWKTYPAFDLLGDSPLYSQTWPRSGSVSNGIASEHPTWAPAIKGSGYSSWPTARAEDSESCGNHPGATDSLTGATKQWQTPNTPKGGGMVRGGERGNELLLPGQAASWATPDCNTSTYSNGKMGPNIREQSASWTTQTATERSGQGERNRALVLDVANWPTPASRDQKGANSEEHATVTGGGRKHMVQLPNFVAYSPQAHAIRDGATSSPDGPTSPRLRLNPNFVDWLMGWPVKATSSDLTASDAEEMELWRCKLDSHLCNLLGERG